MGQAVNRDFWRGRRILLTGHTGFKGSWAAIRLAGLGADITGLALAPEPGPNLFTQARIAGLLAHNVCDLRDVAAVTGIVSEAAPEIAIHMAAQPLVRRSYRDPVETFATNALGTVHLLEALRNVPSLKALLVITSDKVYADDGTGARRGEGDRLGGRDPYSASKAMTELAVASYAKSFFEPDGIAIATARGGNVIGGGDYSEDRILPDAWRAIHAGEPLVLRNPAAVRPWQHVFDCIEGYLAYIEHLLADPSAPRSLNIGPDGDTVTVEELVRHYLAELGAGGEIRIEPQPGMIETHHLALDTSAARRLLGHTSGMSAKRAVSLTAEWHRRVDSGEDALHVTREQIAAHG